MAANAGRSPGIDVPLSIWNCLGCKKRKIKCDRRSPCTNCVKAGHDCVFPVSGRIPTRRDQSGTGGQTRDSREKQTELLDRLRRLENIINGLTPVERNVTVSAVANSSDDEWSSSTPPSTGGDGHPKIAGDPGKIIVDNAGSSYVGNRFWVAISDEVEDLRKELEATSISTDPGDERDAGDDAASSKSSAQTGSEAPQLCPALLRCLWEVYVKNVDLNVKVIHVPTIEVALSECKDDIRLLGRGLQALMTVICLAAVVSLTDDQVVKMLCQSKDDMISSLRSAVDKALSQADVLTTTDLIVIQAMIIYLEIVGPKNGNKATWALAGQLSRTAVSMGLHRDGINFPDVSPFDTEMRRRSWWHILFVDERVGDGQASELLISESVFDTRPPTNLNDSDIFPGMKHTPSAREGVTESTICILRAELWRLSRALLPSLSVMQPRNGKSEKTDDAERLIASTQKCVEVKILRYLDPSQIAHRHIAGLVRLSLLRADLLANHAFALIPQSSKSFLGAWAYLELTHTMATAPEMVQWNWIFTGCTPWYALSTLLMQLRRWSWGTICEQAWTAVARVAEDIPDSAWKDGSHRPVKDLLVAVRSHRSDELGRLKVSDVWKQMGSLGEFRVDWLGGSLFEATIDLTSAEERLQLETGISAGKLDEGLGSGEERRLWNELLGMADMLW